MVHTIKKGGIHLTGADNTHFVREGDTITILQTQDGNINSRKIIEINLSITEFCRIADGLTTFKPKAIAEDKAKAAAKQKALEDKAKKERKEADAAAKVAKKEEVEAKKAEKAAKKNR